MKEKDIILFMDQLAKNDHSEDENVVLKEASELLNSIALPSEDVEELYRFQSKITAYEEGLDDVDSSTKSIRFKTRSYLPFLSGIAAAVLVMVGFLSYQSHMSQQDEIRDLKNMLALSMMQQTSTSNRIDGIALASHVNTLESSLVNELLNVLNTDADINVRLSVINALRDQTHVSNIRKKLIETISQQDSEIVAMTLCKLVLQHASRDEYPIIMNALTKSGIDEDRILTINQALHSQI